MRTTARPTAFPLDVSAIRRIHPDVIGVCTLLVLTLVGTAYLWNGGIMVGVDSAGYFHPMYTFLGERLRAFDIPGWNPAQFSGAPFAADPESGWTYLPAMILFTLLPFALAAKVFTVLPFVLAGFTTYAFARVIGMTVSGALLAAIAYEFSGFSFAMSTCCPIFSQVAAWLPVTLLGVELAIRAQTWLIRVAWWGVASFALSQIFAAWLGQGTYYA
ncbi:MAG: hypothetical protein H0W06_10470, partial [Chloroflexia bacterium]|nr:hypothetical protein [Chloroflexia bacterium]